MLWWNAQWRLDVDIANVTAAYAGVNIAGPAARARCWRRIETDIDFSAEAFPYMAVRQGSLGGIPVRVLRVGFVGELGYEIHCPVEPGRRAVGHASPRPDERIASGPSASRRSACCGSRRATSSSGRTPTG